MTTLMISSATDLRDCVRDASARGTPLRVVGAGTWLDAGRPVRAVESVSTQGLSGIVDYVPGDLTLTARAGTSLAEIREATGKHNQWLALDPHGADAGTLGATIATASGGPLATTFGTPRDLVLGIEFVTGTGNIARAGGKVVKNVAGFDLTRLMTGAWGTLGVISEATVRLHACPQVDETIGVPIAGDVEALDRTRQLLRRLAFTPYACEVLSASFARAVLGGRDESIALFRLAGNLESVSAQRAALLELGQPFEVSADAWSALRSAEPSAAIVYRLSRRASEVGTTWAEANRIVNGINGALLHATPARGVVRCIIPNAGDNVSRLVAALTPGETKRIGERMPEQLWNAAFTSRVMSGIPARIKAAFDPRGVLNPGIFGEGLAS